MPQVAPSATHDPAVRLSGVRLDRGARTILEGIDLQVPRGSVTAILGPSGSGKSTLLAALTGELPPAAGTVEVFGQPVPRRHRELLELRKGIGVLLQGNGLLTDLTEESEKRGWDKKLSPSLQTTTRYDGDGIMGRMVPH